MVRTYNLDHRHLRIGKSIYMNTVKSHYKHIVKYTLWNTYLFLYDFPFKPVTFVVNARVDVESLSWEIAEILLSL